MPLDDLGTLRAGDVIHFDPRALPALVIITEAQAKAIEDASPKRQFVVSWGKAKK
jgi:hypothetical protein